MAKYNVGDILEITEDFAQLGADFKRGDKYSVVEVGRSFYTLKSDDLYFTNPISKVDTHSGFRKVEPKVGHMELGKTYQSTVNDLFYTPTEFDFEAGRVRFDYKSSPSSFAYKSDRPFYGIEEEFGVLPPVNPVEVSQVTLDELKEKLKPENTLAEAEQEDIGGWDREEFASAATKPETVSVDALREAYEYVNQEYLDLEKLIELAKRLS